VNLVCHGIQRAADRILVVRAWLSYYRHHLAPGWFSAHDGIMTTLAAPTDTVDPAARRRELGVFLRSRRERIRPDEVGFAPGVRRRTPGLRREEVALLAGVGVTWYTWLEQGRDINVSAQVLDAIATALRFDRQERSHLFRLAGLRFGPAPGACTALPATVQKTLDAVAPYPAIVLNERYDILAFNDAYSRVVLDLDQIPVEERNLLWLNFVSDDWKCSFVDGESTKHHMVATFRAASADHLGEAMWQELIQGLLSSSQAFAELWERYDVAAPSTRTKLLESAELGILRIEPINLWLSPIGPLRATVYTALDEETEAKLRLLVEAGATRLPA
jgi:transcriptional regulator with XRE-family HTH domain